MRKKMYIFLLFLLIISTNTAFGNGRNKTKIIKPGHDKHNTKLTVKSVANRLKRSIYDENEKLLWPQKKLTFGQQKYYATREDSDVDDNDYAKESPFWGNRGRRDSSSAETGFEVEYPVQELGNHPFIDKYCKNIFSSETLKDLNRGSVKDRREEQPFWGNRGRRSSEETGPFWGNRGRRQSNEDEPFWGTRGRREDDGPFWGNRGRRDDEPFWGNRGRRDDEPFWGNRGRRQDTSRDNVEPFWSSRGRRQENEPFWGNRGRRKEDLKESILEAINDVQGDIENLSRLRRSNLQTSFWANRARDSKLKNLFNNHARMRSRAIPSFASRDDYPKSKISDPRTVHDNRMYAEEPHYIIVDRSSRSSIEDDPYFISRGKKYNMDSLKTERDRRGAIEEIVKSVRNDPYYIARGKKDSDSKNANLTALPEELSKAKELICSTIDLIVIKNQGNKTKREINENERERRTILKKLAAQLQMDPYFASRGKRSEGAGAADVDEFIGDVAARCN